MLSDLSALLPPLLVAAAFLIAVVAFLRHEMGRRGSRRDSGSDSSRDGEADESSERANPAAESGRTAGDDSFRRDSNSDSSPPPGHTDG